MKKNISKLLIIVCVLSVAQIGCYKDNKESMYPSVGDCDTSFVTWAQDIRPIVNRSCGLSGCHNAALPSDGYDFTNYAGVKLMVDNNRFLAVVESGTMPKGAARLDPCDINKIRAWIQAGALE